MDLIILVIFFIFAAIIGLVVWIQIARAGSHRKLQLQYWNLVAKHRGGTLHPAQGAFGHHTLSVDVEGVPVQALVTSGLILDKAIADSYTTAGGWHTVVHARYAAGGGPSLKLQAGANHSGWTERFNALMRDIPPGTEILSGGNVVSAVYSGVILNPKALDNLIAIVADIVGGRAVRLP